ncbi:hypothetical protein OPKNFCMD_6880 [Methylobacterium crusticola]|uniref:Uncharacterized protein n=1 Tax=Methylobacterium crusticola TaxID=1697972 RepID=A0ABQ4RAH3_9HYPH|nr:hypothetical protein OPKNFCMD_6880 [Methylobacterium crusticola]
MVPVTVLVAEPPRPSDTVALKPTGPVASAAGTKVRVPSGFNVTVPLGTATEVPAAIAWPSMAVTVSGSPSTSLSLARRSKVTAPSSGTVNPSSPRTGASLTGVMVPVTTAVELPPCPSDTV